MSIITVGIGSFDGVFGDLFFSKISVNQEYFWKSEEIVQYPLKSFISHIMTMTMGG